MTGKNTEEMNARVDALFVIGFRLVAIMLFLLCAEACWRLYQNFPPRFLLEMVIPLLFAFFGVLLLAIANVIASERRVKKPPAIKQPAPRTAVSHGIVYDSASWTGRNTMGGGGDGLCGQGQ